MTGEKDKDKVESIQSKLSNMRVKLCNIRKRNFQYKKHVILIGDSHMRGYAANMKTLLSDQFEVYGVVKPGSVSSALMESAKNYIGKLTSDDVLLVCSSTNHLEIGNSMGAITHILNFGRRNYHTNIILLSVPQRYDSIDSLYITNKTEAFNRALTKLAKTFSHTRILEIDHNRNLFTNHGLYLNYLMSYFLNK